VPSEILIWKDVFSTDESLEGRATSRSQWIAVFVGTLQWNDIQFVCSDILGKDVPVVLRVAIKNVVGIPFAIQQ
jgi:hypothetical protein